MNPLSSINAYLRPNGLIQFMPQAGQVRGPIPAAELNQISDGVQLAKPAGTSFGDVLGKAVQEVSAKQSAASAAVTGLISGQNISLHQAMISMQEASVSFQLMVEVRNKLLESYQELMRMQV
jgi:flagellar hook-basal body complex protein FliE